MPKSVKYWGLTQYKHFNPRKQAAIKKLTTYCARKRMPKALKNSSI